MVHVRVVVAPEKARRVLALVAASPAASNVVHLEGAVSKPVADLVLFDLPSDEVSLTLDALRELRVPVGGSIAVMPINSQVSSGGVVGESAASASEAVIWEEVEDRTSQMTSFSAAFVTFMVLAMMLAVVGVLARTTILVIAAMIVGPDFGPIAGTCVAVVQRRKALAGQALVSLLGGFAAGICLIGAISLALRHLHVFPAHFSGYSALPQSMSAEMGAPGRYTFLVAFIAGIIGMLSLSTARSSVLIGVLVSVTTIPAAANVALTSSYGRFHDAGQSAEQLGANIATLLVSGILTLAVQRMIYGRSQRRRRRDDPGRRAAGLPEGS